MLDTVGVNMFTFIRHFQILFQAAGIILHSHQQSKRVSVAYHHLAFYFYFSHSNRCIIMVLICISLMANFVKHLFMGLFTMLISSLVEYSSFLSVLKLDCFLIVDI